MEILCSGLEGEGGGKLAVIDLIHTFPPPVIIIEIVASVRNELVGKEKRVKTLEYEKQENVRKLHTICKSFETLKKKSIKIQKLNEELIVQRDTAVKHVT